MVTHIIREAVSPPDADVWTMWCGDQCFAFDDGTLVPTMDFFHEDAAEQADCSRCKAILACAPSVTAAETA